LRRKTDRPIPGHLLLRVARQLADECVSPPVKAGDVLVRDVMGTGANVVATSDLDDSCDSPTPGIRGGTCGLIEARVSRGEGAIDIRFPPR
jgi:hypothetical protein